MRSKSWEWSCEGKACAPSESPSRQNVGGSGTVPRSYLAPCCSLDGCLDYLLRRIVLLLLPTTWAADAMDVLVVVILGRLATPAECHQIPVCLCVRADIVASPLPVRPASRLIMSNPWGCPAPPGAVLPCGAPPAPPGAAGPPPPMRAASGSEAAAAGCSFGLNTLSTASWTAVPFSLSSMSLPILVRASTGSAIPC